MFPPEVTAILMAVITWYFSRPRYVPDEQRIPMRDWRAPAPTCRKDYW